MQIKMAYCYPERTVKLTLPDGKLQACRAPNSPTRPARATDVNTWFEEQAEEKVTANG